MMRTTLLIGMVVVVGACSPPSQRASGQPVPTSAPVVFTGEDRAFIAKHEAVEKEAESMGAADFAERYPVPPALQKLSYDPLDAEALDDIEKRVRLSSDQRKLLGKNGFVVVTQEKASYSTPSRLYGLIYAGHLPVFISSDSLLYALHRSFDSILKMLEETVMISELTELLREMHEGIAKRLTAGSATTPAMDDVDVYLTVARSLLLAKPMETVNTTLQSSVATIMSGVKSKQPQRIALFGGTMKIDFSQMTPRGHYTESKQLAQYFQAMMWLGRTEMALVKFSPQEPPMFQRQAFEAAHLLTVLLREGEAQARLDRINMILERLIGEQDSMDPADMTAFVKGLGGDKSALAKTDDALLQPLLASRFGVQRIMSQIIHTNPKAPQSVLPRSFLFLGQRFVIDSEVFHRVTYDRLIHPETGEKTRRMLPEPLDVQFALGSNAAGELLRDSIDTFAYQGALHEARFLVESHPGSFWDDNIYNSWLAAIRALNVTTQRHQRPESMRTRAWDYKTLNTQLAGWAELRHDTLLYAKQSYSVSIECEYPNAYVEPVPAFYKQMSKLAELGVSLSSELKLKFPVERLEAYFVRMRTVMNMLETIAQKELEQRALTEDEKMFLKGTIERETVGCGEVQYDGWYPELFFKRSDVANFKPTIADIHTTPTDAQGNQVGWVLHAATGAARYMIVTVDHGDGSSHAFVGPVSSYHQVRTGNFKRLDNAAWKETLQAKKAAWPSWTATYQ